MEETIIISYLNDFIFCPISIYFHKLYGNRDKLLYQSEYQLNGTDAHKTIDQKTYTTSKDGITRDRSLFREIQYYRKN